MIDLHAHILPGFDDGASSLAESIEMAWQAYEDGITTIVAAPHIIDPTQTHRERIIAAVAALQERLDLGRIGVRIIAGAEIHIGPDVTRVARAGELMTINDGGRYILLELPLNEMPQYTRRVVFDLLASGVTPIIAHPERCLDIARNWRLLAELVASGCLAQVSTGSVRGRFGKGPKRAAATFLGKGLVHFLATDGHGAASRRVRMAAARSLVAERYGEETACRLTQTLPAAVLAGEDIEPFTAARCPLRPQLA